MSHFTDWDSLHPGDWVEAYDNSVDFENGKFYFGYVIHAYLDWCQLLAPTYVSGSSMCFYLKGQFPKYLLKQFIVRNTRNVNRKLDFVPYEL